MIWRTMDGRELTLDQMEDAHILNSLAMLLKRKATELKAWRELGIPEDHWQTSVQAFIQELCRRKVVDLDMPAYVSDVLETGEPSLPDGCTTKTDLVAYIPKKLNTFLELE